MKKYIAELFGTFSLTLVVGLSLSGLFPISTPILAGLTLGLFVYSIGSISGAHINPAVTLGLWSIKKINTQDALMYIIAQIIGAVIAAIFVTHMVGLNQLVVDVDMFSFIAELLGTLLFTFGIASVVYGKVKDVASGLVIGGSLLLGISIAVLLGSNGILNPAVAFGINSFNWVYLIAPIIGSVLGMNVYKYLQK